MRPLGSSGTRIFLPPCKQPLSLNITNLAHAKHDLTDKNTDL